jgi:hypothetical protein
MSPTAWPRCSMRNANISRPFIRHDARFCQAIRLAEAMEQSYLNWQVSRVVAIVDLRCILFDFVMTETSPHVAFPRATVPTARRAPL